MGDAFSVPFILSWCQRVNKLSQLNKKRHSGHVHTNPDKLMYCILHICVNTNSVWCIRFGLSIHTNMPLRIRIVFARPNENAYYLLRNMHNASSIYDIWHHRIRKPPFWSIHTKMRSRRFQKSPLWRMFLKSCVLGDRFHQIRMNGAYAGHFKSSFQVSNYRRQNRKIGFNSCNKTGDKSEQSCNRTLLSAKMKVFISGRFPKVRTGRRTMAGPIILTMK